MAKDENKTNKNVKKENKKFFKNFKAELKKVVWPTPKQLANNTIAVITIVLITTAIVFALDFTFEKANQYGVEKLKSSVESKKNNEAQNNTTVDNNGNLNENNDSESAQSENSEEQNSNSQAVE